MEKIKKILSDIYGDEIGLKAFERIFMRLNQMTLPQKKASPHSFFSQEDVILITYGDSLVRKEAVPLKTLYDFCRGYLQNHFSTIHFLPFFPYSSDDGFSVIDFYKIRPDLGTMEDVSQFKSEFSLMFDFVLNHISSKSPWFQKYLNGEKGFENLAIEVDPLSELSDVVRPRALPLLTEYQKNSGEKVSLWTTFSEDQIDLNYESIDVLEKMVDILIFYVEKGAALLRMDAVAYLWKKMGTSCIHLPETHLMVKLFRSILDVISPGTMIVTETNVPHDENISYFGSGKDEAQMVYNFTLPPLLLHTFIGQDTALLNRWVNTLKLSSEQTTFFNFTASHDGIGVRPLEGILPKSSIDQLIDSVKLNNGNVSYKENSDGSKSPYELNISYIDAIKGKESLSDEMLSKKFLASQSIPLVLKGVPGIYIHSLLGSRNWVKGVEETGRYRTINRQRLSVDEIMNDLEDPECFRSRIFFSYLKMLHVRIRQSAFHPNSHSQCFDLHSKIFVLKRKSLDQIICALTNISSQRVKISLNDLALPQSMVELISGRKYVTENVTLEPYQYIWLSHMI